MKALVIRQLFVPAVAVMVIALGGPLLAAPLYETSFDGAAGNSSTRVHSLPTTAQPRRTRPSFPRPKRKPFSDGPAAASSNRAMPTRLRRTC